MTLSGLFSKFEPRRILLAGDFNIDTYVLGEVTRISPEAPVPILRVQKRYSRPGSAGNAALNLRALGMEVRAVGRIGADPRGQELSDLLMSEGVDPIGLLVQREWATPVKERMIAQSSNQQMMRVDYEEATPLSTELEQALIDRLDWFLEGIDLVAVSDYGKGALSPRLLQELIGRARSYSIPTIVDPKGRDFSRYAGATVIKPNQGEAYEAAGLGRESSLEKVAETILASVACDHLLVTCASEGAALFSRECEVRHFEVKIREVRDVTGAGDTVLAAVVAAVANQLSLEEGVRLGMVAAGLAVEHLGCAVVALPDLARRLFEEDCLNKIFGEEHLFALSQALTGTPYGLLSVSAEDGLSTSLLRHIRKLADKPLILYVEEEEPDEEYVQLLASLADVRFVLLKQENLKQLCTLAPPASYHRLSQESLHSLEELSPLLEPDLLPISRLS
jgi:D-beta-D-heptose 7-phosphate kinase / D-beta-D-heptose 1-phosphate adenosyltransferase